MRTITLLLLSAFAALAQIESAEYRFAITQPELLSNKPFISALPWTPNVKPLVLVVASRKDGTPDSKEHRVTLRWEAKDGKVYRQTLAGTRSADGIFAVFDVEAARVLSVDVERVNPPVIQEAQ